MTIYVVLETTGGWAGTDPFRHIYRAFRSQSDAERYVVERKRTGKTDRWQGEIHEVTLDDVATH